MILVTVGDPEGIGPEVAAKAADGDCVLVGDPGAIERWSPKVPVVAPPDGDEPVEIRAIRFAVAECLASRAEALVTGPIHKARLAARGFEHPGHTGFLGELCGARPVMAFIGAELRACLVTTHVPLSRVPSSITSERLLHVFRVAAGELRSKLGLEGRLLVCGLNPHAGDGGVLGSEEIEIITPAIEQACSEGLTVGGPMSAEVAFRRQRSGHADMVVAMFHDQGLAPLKLVESGQSVNWSMGLPIVRTSVDHGTADDIAGQGVADPTSMASAIGLARVLAR